MLPMGDGAREYVRIDPAAPGPASREANRVVLCDRGGLGGVHDRMDAVIVLAMVDAGHETHILTT